MRIVRYQKNEEIFYGMLQGEEIRTIEGNIFGEFVISSRKFDRGEVKLLAPVDPPNIIAIGLNYRKHADESGQSYPEAPLIFLKATSSLIGPEDNIILPDMALMR